MIKRLVRFGLVGIAAAMTHFLTVVTLVRGFMLDPQIANIGGFLVAFIVSFAGQWGWTFRDQNSRLVKALPSYFGVSVTGFLMNALAYKALLRYTSLDYKIALAMVLVAVAGSTYLLSRYWAFKTPRAGVPPSTS